MADPLPFHELGQRDYRTRTLLGSEPLRSEAVEHVICFDTMRLFKICAQCPLIFGWVAKISRHNGVIGVIGEICSSWCATDGAIEHGDRCTVNVGVSADCTTEFGHGLDGKNVRLWALAGRVQREHPD